MADVISDEDRLELIKSSNARARLRAYGKGAQLCAPTQQMNRYLLRIVAALLVPCLAGGTIQISDFRIQKGVFLHSEICILNCPFTSQAMALPLVTKHQPLVPFVQAAAEARLTGIADLAVTEVNRSDIFASESVDPGAQRFIEMFGDQTAREILRFLAPSIDNPAQISSFPVPRLTEEGRGVLEYALHFARGDRREKIVFYDKPIGTDQSSAEKELKGTLAAADLDRGPRAMLIQRGDKWHLLTQALEGDSIKGRRPTCHEDRLNLAANLGNALGDIHSRRLLHGEIAWWVDQEQWILHQVDIFRDSRTGRIRFLDYETSRLDAPDWELEYERHAVEVAMLIFLFRSVQHKIDTERTQVIETFRQRYAEAKNRPPAGTAANASPSARPEDGSDSVVGANQNRKGRGRPLGARGSKFERLREIVAADPRRAVSLLSALEQQMLNLALQGINDAEIAGSINRPITAVSDTMHRVYAKLFDQKERKKHRGRAPVEAKLGGAA